ncbi:MAG TPA: SPFH domain-containing protein [Gemmatimonadaceae bacterium]
MQPPPFGLSTIAGVLLVALFFGFLFLFVSRYKRCPANKVLIISGSVGSGQSAKVVSGGGKFIWPVIQEYAYLDLMPLQIDIQLKDALSAENIRLAVPSAFTVAIGQTPELQQNAAARLLSLADDANAVRQLAQTIIFGVMRSVIAAMRIEEINRDRDALLAKIQEHLSPELKKIGLVLINVNIHDLRDESGYIEAIGKKAAATAVQQARGDVAEQEKNGEINIAAAQREKAVQVANAEKDREIGLAQATQSKRVAVAEADAQAIAGEAAAQGRVAQTQSELKIKQATAFQAAETAQATAEGSVQEARNRAQAKAALAEAERVEAEQRAALEAPAKAEKARRIVEAEAAAQQVLLAADAEGKAIKIRKQAEAEGEYAVLSKRAEALGILIDKAGGAREAFALLMVDNIPQIAKTAADAIANIKIDKVVVWDGGQPGGGTAGFLRNMAGSLPPVMAMMKDIAGVELPSVFGTMTEDGAATIPPGTRTPATVVAEAAAR